MFWKKKSKTSPTDVARETLFGDLPLEKWGDINNEEEPWKSFGAAAQQVSEGQIQKAIETLRGITQLENLESRHYIQAWHFLKQLGHINDEPTKLFGVVIEVSMRKNDYDLLAAYSDLSARYYNFSGTGVVWENPNSSLHNDLKEVLKCGKEAMDKIGPWEGPRPGPVRKGMVRLNLLTSNGLHFGEAPMSVMNNDPIGGSLLNASTILMRKLIEKTSDT